MNQNHDDSMETLSSYLKIALGQIKKAQTLYNEKIIHEQDIRSLSYQILSELIMEQIQNENSPLTTR
jgi:hypothetical protein